MIIMILFKKYTNILKFINSYKFINKINKYNIFFINKICNDINKYLPNFKHLYLTINVLNENCSNDFNKMISYMSNLESLYIGVNQ